MLYKVKNCKNLQNCCNSFQPDIQINSYLVKMLYVPSNNYFFFENS